MKMVSLICQQATAVSETEWGPVWLSGMEALLSPISCRQDSSLYDLPWVPHGRFGTVANQGRSSQETTCSVQLLSRVRLCDPINRSTPSLPVHHQLPEFTQTHVHLVSDAIHPSHPPSSPSPPALNLSQHQGLCKWVSSSHEVAKGLEFQLQHQSFQWTPRTDTYWYLLEELLRTKVYT